MHKVKKIRKTTTTTVEIRQSVNCDVTVKHP